MKMRTRNLIGLLVILLLVGVANFTVVLAHDGDDEDKQLTTHQGVEETVTTTIPKRYYYLAKIESYASTEIMLPPLEYWGVGTAAWGTPEAAMVREAPAIAAQAKLAGAIAVVESECTVADYSCKTELEFDDKGLSAVTRSFAQDVSDRNKRLAIYLALQNALEQRYGAPTDHVLPAESVNGEDAYVLGLDSVYQERWVGSGSTVDLILSDDALTITHSVSPGGKAWERAARFQELETYRTTLPDSHLLNQIGSGESE